MPTRQRRVYFVYKGQPGFIYRPFGRNEDDPIMQALLKQCDRVQIDGHEPLVRGAPARPGTEELQAKINSDRGTVVSLSVGGIRIPVNER